MASGQSIAANLEENESNGHFIGQIRAAESRWARLNPQALWGG